MLQLSITFSSNSIATRRRHIHYNEERYRERILEKMECCNQIETPKKKVLQLIENKNSICTISLSPQINKTIFFFKWIAICVLPGFKDNKSRAKMIFFLTAQNVQNFIYCILYSFSILYLLKVTPSTFLKINVKNVERCKNNI